MFVELIKSTLTKYQWRNTKYRHENGNILQILLPPCHRKGHHGIIFNEIAEAKMLLIMGKKRKPSTGRGTPFALRKKPSALADGIEACDHKNAYHTTAGWYCPNCGEIIRC